MRVILVYMDDHANLPPVKFNQSNWLINLLSHSISQLAWLVNLNQSHELPNDLSSESSSTSLMSNLESESEQGREEIVKVYTCIQASEQ